MAPAIGIACAALLALLLIAPIDVHVALERERTLQTRLSLSCLFGLVRFRVHPRGARERPEPEAAPPRRREERSRRKERRGRRARFAGGVALRMLSPELRTRSLRFVRDLLRALRPRDLRLRARLGMPDPADTGQLWGLLGPLGASLSSRNVYLEPAFGEACFQLEASARVRMVPAQLFILITTFLLSPAVVRALLSR